MMGTEDVEGTSGMQPSVMEVDEGGEDKVVAVNEGKPSRWKKWAPLSPPKLSRKWVHTMMATQMQVGGQEKAAWQGVVCVPTDSSVRCANCKAKHYGCSLVPVKEASGGKGQSFRITMCEGGSWKAKRGVEVKGVAPLSNITSGKSSIVPNHILLTLLTKMLHAMSL